MTHKELDTFLRRYREDEIESKSLTHGFEKFTKLLENKEHLSREDERFIKAFSETARYAKHILDNNVISLPSDDTFRKASDFHVRVNDRFGYMPFHTHDFIELVYVYSGVCKQLINDESIEMQPGDICILDMQTRHKIIPGTEDDIAVNLLMKPQFFNFRFFEMLGKNELMADFFVQSLKNRKNESNYLLFRHHERSRVKWVVNTIICEYFSEDIGSGDTLLGLMQILFTELLRTYRNETGAISQTSSIRTDVNNIISFIKSNYIHCTLEDIAKEYNYAPIYISKLIKKSTGRNFSQIKQDFRMQQAAYLLQNSSLSVTEISDNVGYVNSSYFYKAFKKHYGKTPQRFRAGI